jgi:predicted methyltransferase
MKDLTELVSHLLLKDIYPSEKGEDHIRSVEIIPTSLINMFDCRCCEGIKIEIQDIAPELASKNPARVPKPCRKQRKISG